MERPKSAPWAFPLGSLGDPDRVVDVPVLHRLARVGRGEDHRLGGRREVLCRAEGGEPRMKAPWQPIEAALDLPQHPPLPRLLPRHLRGDGHLRGPEVLRLTAAATAQIVSEAERELLPGHRGRGWNDVRPEMVEIFEPTEVLRACSQSDDCL